MYVFRNALCLIGPLWGGKYPKSIHRNTVATSSTHHHIEMTRIGSLSMTPETNVTVSKRKYINVSEFLLRFNHCLANHYYS